jgi:hypothetical protein
MWGHYGSKIMRVFSRPFNKVSSSTTNILWWYKLSFYGGLCPFVFIRSWALVASYLCFKFSFFDKPILEEYVSQVEGGPHLLQSSLCVVRNGFFLVAKEMHPSFANLGNFDIPGLHAYLMDTHHDTSFRSILEDDFISLTSRAHICSYSKIWLVVRPSMRFFCIPHFIFILVLCFQFGLIHPLAFSLFTCDCAHELDASSTHLARCPFGG